jgi:ribosomal-protein-alanine N-acetyltransferase
MTVTLSPPATRAPSPAGLDTAGSRVAVSPLRPLHVLELARLTLDHPELTGGSDLATYVRTRRWAMHLVARRPHDTRAFLVTDVGRPVGVAVLDEIRRGSACSARVSVWIHRGDRRRGVGSAAVDRLGALAADLGLRRLEAAVLPDDPAARGVLAATGFVALGLSRGHRLVAGRWEDHVLFERAVTSGG